MENGQYPTGNLPRLRIAQLASFLSQHDFVFEQLLACRTRQEVNRLFRTEASPYWSGARHTPEGPEENPKRVGQHKTDVFGINVVSILQYVYGSYIQNEELRDRLSPCWNVFPPKRTNTRGRGSQPESIPATHSTRRG